MLEDNSIYYGGEVKALGGGKVGGFLVLFSGANDPDLYGDFFTAETDFYLDGDNTKAVVLYDHGLDATLKTRKLGRGSVAVRDVGLWIEAQLEMRDEYEKAIYKLAEAGKLGWSSGSSPHLVQREPHGKSFHLKSWPIVEASLTTKPVEPRTSAVALKSIAESHIDLSSVMAVDNTPPPSTVYSNASLDAILAPAARANEESYSNAMVSAAEELIQHSEGVLSGLKAYRAYINDKQGFRFTKDGRVLSQATLARVNTLIDKIEGVETVRKEIHEELKSIVKAAEMTAAQRDMHDEAVRFELWQVSQLLNKLPKE